MSSALGMNLMPPTSAFQHGGSLQQPPNETPQPSENPTNNTNASELNNSSKDNHDPYDSSDMRRSSSGQDEEEDDDMLERPLEDEDDSLGNKLRLIRPQNPATVRGAFTQFIQNGARMQVMDPRMTSTRSEDPDDEDDYSKGIPAQDSFLDDSYGSPAGNTNIRQSFSNIMDEDEESKEELGASTPDLNRSRNKRKNFKPRNILSDTAKAAMNLKKNLLMPQKRDNSPMDLSVQGANGVEHEDDTDEELENGSNSEAEKMTSSSPSMASTGLSVVRPEVLFGQAGGGGMPDFGKMMMGIGGQQPPIPPFLAPFLAASREAQSGAPSMKEAFQEVLKIFGFPPELAEVFAKNAQALQQGLPGHLQPQQPSNESINNDEASRPDEPHQHPHRPHSPPSNLPSGMLSAALLGGSSNTNNASGHPPTPPRTPKAQTSIAAAMAAASASSGAPGEVKPPMAHSQSAGQQQQPPQPHPPPPPPMPPLLSLAAIQDQVKSPNILAAQLSKPMLIPGIGGNNWPPPGMSGMPPQLPPHLLAAQRGGLLPGSTKSPTDYTRYFRRFSSSLECGSYYCKDMNYREHFHCTVPMCKSKVFAKKEEMIRHSKWHQKMDEAYKYGFRRVTPTDDCSDQFPGCQHNKKQTHYHCIQSGHCDKVYISTSDVQMHFNYHRKDNAIQREGFLRFRGCEDCATHYCPFRGQKTTHFHCNRSSCQFTFKNKADMEKHKNFHMKDEQLNKDGFKKFMKQDPCGYDNCRFSKTVNHIHCIRSNCDYVLHSSGQLFAHKRKHERRDNELAYRKYKLTQSMLASLGPNATDEQKEQVAKIAEAAAQNMNGDLDRPPSANGSMISESSATPPLQLPPSMQPQPNFQPPPPPPIAAISMLPQLRPNLPPGLQLPGFPPHQPLPASGMFGNPLGPSTPPPGPGGPGGPGGQPLLSEIVRDRVPDDAWQNYMLHFDSGEGCGFQGCEVEDLAHYHCKDDGCEMIFRHEDGVREHGRNHFMQDQISELFFVRGDPEDEPELPECPESCVHRKTGLHFHCKWENCTEVIFSSDPPFKRLDHYKLHEYTRKWNFSSANKEPVTMTLTTSIDAMFKRKRGRPPKNRVIEVWNDNFPGQMLGNADLHGSPQAVFTSFKLPKPGDPQPQIGGGGGGGPIGHNSGIPSSLPGGPLSPAPGGFASRLFPMGLGNPPSNSVHASPPKVSAPLGGLPALADQILMQHQQQKVEEESNNNRPDSENGDIEASRSPPGTPPPSKRKPEGDLSSDQGTPPKNQGLIKAKGTYYPLTAFPTNMPQGPVMRRAGESPPREPVTSGDEVSPTISLKSKLGVNFMVSFARSGETENPLAKLLQASQDAGGPSGVSPNPISPSLPPSLETPHILSVASHPQYGPEPEEESCGRPFCKLKRRAHFHCNICNQGFTEKDKLEPHLKRHASPAAATEMGNNLAALLKEPPMQNVEDPSQGALPLSLVVSSTSGGALTTTSTVTTAASRTSSPSPSPSPKSTPPPPSTGPSGAPTASSPIALSNNSPIPGLAFPGSPFALNLIRNPLTGLPTPTSSPQTTAHSLLLSQNPFLPPGIMLPGLPAGMPGLPGLPGLRFPGIPGVPNCDPRLPTSPNSAVTAAALQNLSRQMPTDPNSLKRSSPMSDILNDDSLNPEQKKMRLQSSMRMLKDEPVPEGYMRFRFNEDCGFSSCNYREHQTHFHCMRKDCNYRFCDKTRFVQHTARHERLDTLCGSEFEGFRGVPCGRQNCELNALHARLPAVAGDTQKSSSHFHCLKCDYYCTDTNKVVAHRRQHQKLDSIMAAGFEKYTPTQFCPVGGCPHNGKQTHYHCSKCQYAVLGLSQMEGHKYRHMNE